MLAVEKMFKMLDQSKELYQLLIRNKRKEHLRFAIEELRRLRFTKMN